MLRDAVEARLAGAPIELPESLQGATLTPAEPMEAATFDEPEPVAQMTPEQLDAAWAGVAEKQRQLHARLREPEAVEPVGRRVVPGHTVTVPHGYATTHVHVDEDGEPLRPGSREFVAVLEEMRNLHLAKTKDYGQDDDALSNIRTSADVVGMPPWSGAVLRIGDKMHRLKAFHRRGRVEFDGVQDTLLDIASYAVIALVLYREATCTKVQ